MKSYLLCCLLLGSFCCLPAQDLYFPPNTGNWETQSPGSLGWCEAEVDSLYAFLEANQTKSFLLLKHGKIVLERYFGSFSRDSTWVWFSAGKSLTATLVGLAQQDGLLDIQAPTSTYLGEGWTSLPPEQEAQIKVVHQLSMTSGLNEQVFACTLPACLTYVAEPGTRWVYHNGPYTLLARVVEQASGMDYNVFSRTYLKNKIGMGGLWLDNGFNKFHYSTARDMARFGLLIQAKGRWGDTQILTDTAYVSQMVRPSQAMNPSYGYLWWLNGQERVIPPGTAQSYPGPMAPDAPADVLLAAGGKGQFIGISPSEGLVMVRQGWADDDELAPISFHNEIWKRVMQLECATTGVGEVLRPTFHIYPNPSEGSLRVKSSQPVKALRVYDLKGRLRMQARSPHLDLTQLEAGVYLLRGRIDGQAVHRKFIKLP